MLLPYAPVAGVANKSPDLISSGKSILEIRTSPDSQCFPTTLVLIIFAVEVLFAK
ncbi:unannotated protein [freshwater metagenome]|uniref:Unannotated protein n=1 Tax=freshwater metagenome TaxID=449393 RepID=A0A6J6V4L6_9ZZZZ